MSNGELKNLQIEQEDEGFEVIPFSELEPRWTVPGATEGGFLRWLVSWVGGPAGYINPSLGRSVVSDMSVGFMRVEVGCRQKGVHSHTITEIYVILKGHCEGFDGNGDLHHAGPMDCVYIPVGVPHAVRNSGTEPLELLWIHDDVEKKGLSTYYYSEETTPKIGGVKVVEFQKLEANWDVPRASAAPYHRWLVSYVAGAHKDHINYNPKQAAINPKLAMGLVVILPGNKQVPYKLPGNQCYVVIKGTGVIERVGGRSQKLEKLTGAFVKGGVVHSIRNLGEDSLWVCWVQERHQLISSAVYNES